MRVRNVTRRTVLVPGQRFIPPSPDSVAVKDDDNVKALIDAGVLVTDDKSEQGDKPKSKESTP